MQATARETSPRTDWGRVGLVPMFAVLLVLNVAAMATALRERHGAGLVVGLVASGLTVAFYLLVILAYLRRGQATATTPSMAARVAAVVATGLPMLLPFVGDRKAATVDGDVAATVLILAGLSLSVWSIRALGTNLSVFAQSRGLASSGPYRWVRHPLYVGEIVTVLGIVVRNPSAASVLLWLLLVLLQAYRATAEERLLASGLGPSGYDAYRGGTARFVPGVY